jgi:hypothetical protein
MYALKYVDENEIGVVLLLFEGTSFESIKRTPPVDNVNNYYNATVILSSTTEFYPGEYMWWNISSLKSIGNDIEVALQVYKTAKKQMYSTKVRNRIVKD